MVKRLIIFILAFWAGFAFYFVAQAANFGPANYSASGGSYQCDSTGDVHCYFNAVLGNPWDITHQIYSGDFQTAILQKFGNSAYITIEACISQTSFLSGNRADCRLFVDGNIWASGSPIDYWSFSGSNFVGLGDLRDFNYVSYHVYVNNVYSNTLTNASARRVFINTFNAPSSVTVGQSVDFNWGIDNGTSAYLDLSGPISCLSGFVSTNGSQSCTATGVGTITAILSSQGPGTNGPENIDETRTITVNPLPPPGPFSITGISASCPGASTQVSLNWGVSADATTYDIYRRINGGAWNIIFTDISHSPQPRVFPEGTGISLDFYVVAKNTQGTYQSNTSSAVFCAGPVGDIKANGSDAPPSIGYSTAANITWSSSGFTSCTVSPTGWNATNELVGRSTGPLTSNTTYTLTCDGLPRDTVIVNVIPPTASILANGQPGVVPVSYATPVSITWSSTNAGNCTTSPNIGSGSSGSASVSVTSDTTYTLTCTGNGTASDTVTLDIPAGPTGNLTCQLP